MDLKFKEYANNYNNTNNHASGIPYPRPLPGAAIGGALGYALGGPMGGLAGAAAGYGIGKVAGPKTLNYDDPKKWIYYRNADGSVGRDMQPEFDLTPERAAELNADTSHPYLYKVQPNGKYHNRLKPSFNSRFRQHNSFM